MKLIFSLILIFLQADGFSQIYEPVEWKFSATKNNDLAYTMYFKAKISPGWHVYSHLQPKEAVAMPLRIHFNRSPQFKLEGRALEIGKLERYKDQSTGITANQYSSSLTIRQAVRVKNGSKSKVTGTLTYQTCNDERCLPPEDIAFTVSLPPN